MGEGSMSHNNWSSSKFADWIRGTPKPNSGTLKEWALWEKSAQLKKLRCWLAEEGLDYLEGFIYWPMDKLRGLRHYVHNRWISRSHALTSNLRRGQSYEFETRLLHAAFDELVNFVEVEVAHMHLIWADDEEKKRIAPTCYGCFGWLGLWRSPEAGWTHLIWATALKHDAEWVSKENPEYGKPTSQAMAALETMALYKWWKEDRPKRPDPDYASGWIKYCEEREKADKALGRDFWAADESDDEKARSRKILDRSYAIEQAQEDEDTEMLIRLVKIRNKIWT